MLSGNDNKGGIFLCSTVLAQVCLFKKVQELVVYVPVLLTLNSEPSLLGLIWNYSSRAN